MKTALLLLGCVLAGPGCSGGDSEPAPAAAADTSSRRQRDSLIGESRLPGARGVKGALEASDAAAARSATLDSLSGGVSP